MARNTVFTLYSVIKKVNFICATISGIIILFVSFSIVIDVLLRYFFRRPSIWITEMSTYLFLYIIFLSTAYALQEGQHISVTFLRYRLNAITIRILNLICSIFAMTFSAVLLWQTSIMTWTAFKGSWSSPTVLSVPLGYVYLAMVVGTTLLFVTFLLRAILEFRGFHLQRTEGEEQ